MQKVCLALLAILALSFSAHIACADHHEKEISLFDGSDLDQWRGYNKEDVPAAWKIEDGALTLKGRGGDLMTKETFTNYELTFEWKISPGGNSGVIYRVKEVKGQPSYKTGPEYQVLDDGPNGNKNAHSAGACYALYAPEGKESKAAGEWNTAKIVINGNHLEHWINGKKVVDAEFDSDDWNSRVGKSKFKNWEGFGETKNGHIVLQDHGNQVWYKNIKLKKLEGK